MDKVNQKMRKFNLRGVLIGLRATALGNSPHKLDAAGIEETLRSEHFQLAKVRHSRVSLSLSLSLSLSAYSPILCLARQYICIMTSSHRSTPTQRRRFLAK